MKYRCLIFLAMLCVLMDMFIPLLRHQNIAMPIRFINGAAFMSAMTVCLKDIIAEIYGIKVSIQLFVTSAICKFILSLICCNLIVITSFTSTFVQLSYNQVFGRLPSLIILGTTSYAIAWYTNVYLLTKWKIFLYGKYFWLRSVGASLIAQTLHIAYQTVYMLWCAFQFSRHEILLNAITALMANTVLIALLAFPSTIVVSLLRITEINQKNYGKSINQNPFINYN